MEKKAQLWVSVVIYTLVGLTAIGLLLVAIQPRVKEMRDGITIKQTIEALHNFDSALRSTLIAPGNKRNVEFKLSEGELLFDFNNERIIWTMQSDNKFSEKDIPIHEGTIEILTEQGSPWKITLSLNYKDIADLISGDDNTKLSQIIPRAAKPYVITIENMGGQIGKPQKVALSTLY